MEYLKKVYERNEAIKKGADPWSIPIPIPKEPLEYTYEETTDIPEMIPVPTLKTITKKDDNIDVALKEYLAEKGLSTVTGNVKKSYDSTTKKESKPKQQISAIDEYPSTRSKQQKSLADNLGKTTKIKFYDNIFSVMDEYLKENYSNIKKEPKLKPKQQKSTIDSLDNIVNEYLIKNYGITTKKDTRVKPDDKITEVMDEYLK